MATSGCSSARRAGAIRGLQFEPAGLVIACRRIVERHPTSGPLWWFCSSLLTAADPFRAAHELAFEVEHDRTPDHLFDALPDDATVCVIGWPDLIGDAIMRRGDIRVLAVDSDDEGSSFVRRLHRADIDAEIVPSHGAAAAAMVADLVLVEALATGPDEVLVATSSRAAAAVAYCGEVPVWLVAGRGRRLPSQLFTAMHRTCRRRACAVGSRRRADAAGPRRHGVGPDGVVDADAADVLAAECAMAHELVRPSPM